MQQYHYLDIKLLVITLTKMSDQGILYTCGSLVAYYNMLQVLINNVIGIFMRETQRSHYTAIIPLLFVIGQIYLGYATKSLIYVTHHFFQYQSSQFYYLQLMNRTYCIISPYWWGGNSLNT